MLSWGRVVAFQDEAEFASRMGAEGLANHFREMRERELWRFENTAPRTPREQVQWLRALAKCACLTAPVDNRDALQRIWFRWQCENAMWAIYKRRPIAASALRGAAEAARSYAAWCPTSCRVADRLIDSLAPALIA